MHVVAAVTVITRDRGGQLAIGLASYVERPIAVWWSLYSLWGVHVRPFVGDHLFDGVWGVRVHALVLHVVHVCRVLELLREHHQLPLLRYSASISEVHYDDACEDGDCEQGGEGPESGHQNGRVEADGCHSGVTSLRCDVCMRVKGQERE